MSQDAAETGMTLIEGRQNVLNFAFDMTLRALEMEVETGMKMSRMNALRAAQNNFGVKAKTKRGAIKEMRAMKERP